VALDTDWGIWYPGRKSCNSSAELAHRETLIEAHVGRHFKIDAIPEQLTEYRELLHIRAQVLDLLAQADNQPAVAPRRLRRDAVAQGHQEIANANSKARPCFGSKVKKSSTSEEQPGTPEPQRLPRPPIAIPAFPVIA
jgi:hypothetical protein